MNIVKTCWYERTCGKKEEICDNLKNCKNCTRYLQMMLQTEMANIPGELPLDHKHDSSGLDKQAYITLKNLDIQEFVVNGRSLVIESLNNGNGKTSWAKRLLLKYMAKKIGRINTGYFLSLPIVLAEVKEAIQSKEDLPYLRIFSTVRLLVIDEVGANKLTDYEEKWLLRMIEERSKRPGLATIYTANSSPNMREILGRRLYSRIWTASSHITLRESDKRGGVN